MYRHTVRRPHAWALWCYPDHPPVERDCLQCVHCQYTWNVEPGSGKERGWCTGCNGPTCGGAECYVCIPFMKKVEEAERAERFAVAVGLVPR